MPGSPGFSTLGFGLTGSVSRKSIDYFVEKADKPLTRFKSNNFFKNNKKGKELFLSFLADKPAIAEKFLLDDSWDFKKIRAIINEYNTSP